MAGRELIPREVLFGNPERTSVRISPDGKMLGFLAPREGVMNVHVCPIHDIDAATPVTDDKTTGISQFFWCYTNKHLLFLQDDNGDEDFHLYSVDLESDKTIDLTPFDQISAQVVHQSHRHPEEILVGINDRGEHWFHDVHRVNVATGERQLLVQNDSFIGFVSDNDYNVRVAVTYSAEAELLMFKSDSDAEGGWVPWITVGVEDTLTTAPFAFDKTGSKLFFIDSRNRNTASLKSIDVESETQETLFATDQADINGAMIHPTEANIEAVTYTYQREKWEILDDSIRSDIDYLKKVESGELQITSRTLDDRKWTVAYTLDDGPVKYYLYDRDAQNADFLFCHRPELERLELCKMHSMIIKSRDGLDLVSYLTLPIDSDPDNGGRPQTALPMVLLVHGGPWHRDTWGYDPMHQMLANRGYAVLAVNFRGSTGFGKNFINAANLEWAGKMHDDLIDAVNWAVNEGIAIKDRIAVMGGSYGGYAALVGLTFTPDVFACGIDIVGPSNLITLMQNPPPYWMPIMPMMQTRVGDFMTEAGGEFLESRSPLFHVDKISRPLLIGQGATDPRVKQEESDQIVEAMTAKNIPVTYVLFPEEGHGFSRPENDISFNAITEAFLAEHLGGRYEPIGDAFKGAKFEVPSGAEGVPGLAAVVS